MPAPRPAPRHEFDCYRTRTSGCCLRESALLTWATHFQSLELGAGGGLVGLAVASGSKVEQPPLYITDQVEMEELMRHNIDLNGLNGLVREAILNWYVFGT